MIVLSIFALISLTSIQLAAANCGCSVSPAIFADAITHTPAHPHAEAEGTADTHEELPHERHLPTDFTRVLSIDANAQAEDAACTACNGVQHAKTRGTHVPHTVVHIPAGTATLGTDDPHFPADAEGPAYEYAQVRDFYMDKYEVDNAAFAAFVAATGHVTDAEAFGFSFVHEVAIPAHIRDRINQSVVGAEWWLPVQNATWFEPEGPGTNLSGRLDHPVIHVSQRDAATYCRWTHGRLPTEDEWEYAARAGKQQRLFPWGNQLMTSVGGESKARHRANIWQGVFPYNNTVDDGFEWAAPVDAFGAQNAWGLFNVAGNVWEWTSSKWCSDDAPHPGHDRTKRRHAPECARQRLLQRRSGTSPDAGEIDYVKRGGSFMCHIASCYRYRVAARHKNTANSSAYNLGFRCVYDSAPPDAILELNHSAVVKNDPSKSSP